MESSSNFLLFFSIPRCTKKNVRIVAYLVVKTLCCVGRFVLRVISSVMTNACHTEPEYQQEKKKSCRPLLWWANIELKFLLLLIFIYFNSTFKVTCKTRTLNAGTSGLIPKRNWLKYSTLHSPFCLFIRNLKFTSLDGTIRCVSLFLILLQTTRNLALVYNLKSVTYSQPT